MSQPKRGDDRRGPARDNRGGYHGGQRAGTSQHYGGGGFGGQGGGYSSAPRVPKNYPKVEPMRVQEVACKARPKFVPRPKGDAGKCSLGKSIELIANHFRIKIPDITVYQYDLKIDQAGRTESGGGDTKTKGGESKAKVRKLKQIENRRILDKLILENKSRFMDEKKKPIMVVYDGDKNIITPKKLKEDEFTVPVIIQLDQSEQAEKVKFEGRQFKFEVRVKFTNKIDLSIINGYYSRGEVSEVPREVLQAFDIIFRHGPTEKRVPIGKSLYPKQEARDTNGIEIGPNKEVRFGHYQAFHLTKSGPTLLVDRSATAFYKPQEFQNQAFTLLGFSEGILGRQFDPQRKMDQTTITRLEKSLKGLKVYSTHLPYKRSYTIKGIETKTPEQIKFDLEEEGKVRKITVRQYFEEKYPDKLKNGKLNFANLPCIIPQGNRCNYLPLELLHVYPDQPVQRAKIDAMNTAKMVRACGEQGPEERFGEIQQAVNNVKKDSEKILAEFNIEIETRPLQVTGRVINKPRSQGLDKGSRTSGFKISKNLLNWAFFDLSERNRYPDQINNFLLKLKDEGTRLGMSIAQPKTFKVNPDERGDIGKHFEMAKTRVPQLQMVMFLIDGNSSYYPSIKYFGDIKYGIITQCVKSDNLDPKKMIQNKLLFKINTKLEGVNRTVDEMNFKPMDRPQQLSMIDMIVGADVTHPAPGDQLLSSVAAVVGSYNKDYDKYFATIRVQERSTKRNAVEMILNFDMMIEELLYNFKKHNNRFPATILYYRDGVSESQFQQVLEYECDKIKMAFHKLGQKQPKVTFATVQKRHHTRFRPKNMEEGTGRKKNIPAGTVVDTTVTHPTDFDFFMASHEGIQGTSRPTHYYVLQDDNKFSANDLQRLTYYLCYTYSRCENPISIPPPVQYAHLAAYRSRHHIIANRPKEGWKVAGQTEDELRESERKIAAQLNKFVQVMKKHTMYYC